ncbi:MAG: hypothetical protein DMG22_10050 [Acidobacteria bacterium]|nr:MAG: hypothetical protein DMG22_10050 [Acidobacteriota bacterium]
MGRTSGRASGALEEPRIKLPKIGAIALRRTLGLGRSKALFRILSAGLLALAGIVLDWPLPSRSSATLGQIPGQSESQEKTSVLRTRRNEVLVRVVVRDSNGKAVDGLKQEDFRLFDNGKPQVISHFDVERPGIPTPTPAESVEHTPIAHKRPGPNAVEPPRRYVLLVFDNAHSSFEGLVRSREAGKKFLSATMTPAERVAIVTTAGDIAVEFTGDRQQLESALKRLKPNFHGGDPLKDCPRVSDYVVDRQVNYEDPDALSFIRAQAAGQGCPFISPFQAEAFAKAAEGVYRAASLDSLRLLDRMTRRLASAPGERNLILVSRGFVAFKPADILDRIIERALRAGVIISALDPEGLTNPSPFADASQTIPIQPPSIRGEGRASIPNLPSLIESIASSTLTADWEVLAELSESTGGRFFHNNNDIVFGLRELAGSPEVSYVLAFSPENLKADGKFHRLKVELAASKGFTVTARRGYFAPTKTLDAGGQADQEVQDAVFSRDEVRELPVEVSTQFHQLDPKTASLAVRVHLDANALTFHKEGDRNDDNLTFVTVVFDRDGNYVDGHRKRMQLRLTASGLAKTLQGGIGIRDEFHLAPGTYWVREVVRDSELGALSALNTSVDISF